MSMIAWVTLGASLVTGLVLPGIALARTVRRDGLGHRPPPSDAATGARDRPW